MGATSSRPRVATCRVPSLLRDYRSARLNQVSDSYQFWRKGALDGRSPLPACLYEEVFGNLFKDSETHFGCYLPVGQAACNPLETFLMLVLLSAEDSLEVKVRMCLELTRQAGGAQIEQGDDGDHEDSFTPSDVQKTVHLVLSGISRLFEDAPAPSAEDCGSFIGLSLSAFNLLNGPSLRADLSEEEFAYMTQMHAKSQRPMTFVALWRWCQDTRQVFTFLGAISALLLEADILSSSSSSSSSASSSSRPASQPAPPTPPAPDFTRRQNGVLWRYSIKNMVPPAWVAVETPALYGEDAVFSVLEHLVLMPTKCLPIYLKESQHGSDFVGLHSEVVMARESSVASLGRMASTASRMGLGALQMGSKASLAGSSSKAGMRGNASVRGMASSASKTKSKLQLQADRRGGRASDAGMAKIPSRSTFSGRSDSKQSLAASSSRAGLPADDGGKAAAPPTGARRGSKANLGASSSKASLGSSSSKAGLGASSSNSGFGRKSSRASMADPHHPPADSANDIFKKRPGSSSSNRSNSSSRASLDLPGSPSGIYGSSIGSPSGGKATLDTDKTVVTFLNCADFSTILAWFVAKCPKEVTARFLPLKEEEEEEEEEQLGDTEATSGNSSKQRSPGGYYGGTKSPKARAGSASLGGLAGMLPIMVKLKAKVAVARQHVAAHSHALWDEFGTNVTLAPIGLALEGPLLHRRMQFTLATIMQTSSHIYNALDLFAAGYRAIPVAGSALRPYKVTHMLTPLDAASFLYYHAPEVFGKTMTRPVSELHHLTRKPLLIPVTHNFAAAATMLAEKDCEAGVLVDATGQACGLFKASLLGEFWLAWWRQYRARGAEDGFSVEQLQALFVDGEYRPGSLEGLDPKSHSFFAAAQNPLRMCQGVGLAVGSFDVDVGPQEPPENPALASSSRRGSRSSSSSSSSSSGSSSSSSNSGSGSDEEDSSDAEGGGSSSKRKLKRKKSKKQQQPRQPTVPKPSSSSSSASLRVQPKTTTMTTTKEAGPRIKKPSISSGKSAPGAPSPAGSRSASGALAPTPPITPLPPSTRKGRERGRDGGRDRDREREREREREQGGGEKDEAATSVILEAQPSALFGLLKARSVSHAKMGSSRASLGVLGGQMSQLGSALSMGLSRVELSHAEPETEAEAEGGGEGEGEAWKAEWRAARQRKLSTWLVAHDAVLPSDSLFSVLERMHHNRTHKVFVVSPLGVPVGVVSLQDIARDLVLREGKEKVQLHELYAKRAKSHICVRAPAHST